VNVHYHILADTALLLGHLAPLILRQPRDLVLCGYIKDAVYVPTLPNTLPEIAGKTRTTAAKVTPAMLTDVRTELQYRYSTCQATYGALNEHFQTLYVQITKT
jgi:hypothetical protein